VIDAQRLDRLLDLRTREAGQDALHVVSAAKWQLSDSAPMIPKTDSKIAGTSDGLDLSVISSHLAGNILARYRELRRRPASAGALSRPPSVQALSHAPSICGSEKQHLRENKYMAAFLQRVHDAKDPQNQQYLKDLDRNAEAWKASQVGQQKVQEEVNQAYVLKQIALHEREKKLKQRVNKLDTELLDMDKLRFETQDKLAKVEAKAKKEQTRIALEKQMMLKGTSVGVSLPTYHPAH
jgi:hypothetical protein